MSSWQITDHSVECTEHVDRSFSRNLHRSCTVHGGDGFAFVIHADPAAASALGGGELHKEIVYFTWSPVYLCLRSSIGLDIVP